LSESPATGRDESEITIDIVKRIRQGSGRAETELWNRYSRGLLFLLRQRTGDPELAQDLRQETFRIAIEKLRAGGLEDPAKLAGYLRGIAVNLVSGEWRKRDRRKTTADSDAIAEAPDTEANPPNEVSRAELGSLVTSMLQELKVPRDREILLRFYVQEGDKAEICSDLGISAVHFNRVLFRAKSRFRKILLEEERKGRISLVE
jgi:RNA polymerase sigma-70 factor (ECF subfamily)